MTFYSISFAILFLAAFRQLLILWGTPYFFLAAIVAVIVFNDVVNTSEFVEPSAPHGGNAESPRAVQYTFHMKLLDLVNFMILGVALSLLTPRDNPFGAGSALSSSDSGVRLLPIWLLLTAYWSLQFWWNVLAKQYDRKHRASSKRTESIVLWIWLAFMCVLSGASLAGEPWSTLYVFSQPALLVGLSLHAFVETRRILRRTR